MVQTRWSYINRHYSALTEVEAILLDGHFVIEHSSRFRTGLFFNFNGTAGIWRRIAIEDAGGWQHDTLTEDTDLSYRAQLRGWHFTYLPEIDCPSELPVEMNAFKSQQARWAKGLMQTAKKILPRVLRSDMPAAVKAEAIFHLTANISYPLMVFMSIILLPAMIVRFYQGWVQMLIIDLPLFLASTCSISSFYLAAERALYPKTWKRTFLVSALCDGRGHRAFGAQCHGGNRSDRRGQIGIRAHAEISRGGRGARRRRHGRRRTTTKARAGCLSPKWALGLYFAGAVFYALQNENYATVPFLLLFVWGYLYTGLMSLAQTYIERLRFGVWNRERFVPRRLARQDFSSAVKVALTRARSARLSGTSSLLFLNKGNHREISDCDCALRRTRNCVFVRCLSLLRRDFRSPTRNIKPAAPSFALSSTGRWCSSPTPAAKTPPNSRCFFQEPNFYYLTGDSEPDAAILLLPDSAQPGEAKGPREILYLPPRDLRLEKWDGPKMGPDDPGIAQKTGFETVRPFAQLKTDLEALAKTYKTVYTILPPKVEDGYPHFTDALAFVQSAMPAATLKDAAPAIYAMRQVKSAGEIALLQKAVDLSVDAQFAAMRDMRPGLYEYQIAAQHERSPRDGRMRTRSLCADCRHRIEFHSAALQRIDRPDHGWRCGSDRRGRRIRRIRGGHHAHAAGQRKIHAAPTRNLRHRARRAKRHHRRGQARRATLDRRKTA